MGGKSQDSSLAYSIDHVMISHHPSRNRFDKIFPNWFGRKFCQWIEGDFEENLVF